MVVDGCSERPIFVRSPLHHLVINIFDGSLKPTGIGRCKSKDVNVASIPDFDSPVVEHARKDFPLLNASISVGEALEQIRREGVGERVIYFYAVDNERRLVGVLPTRRLLTASVETPLREIIVPRVIAIPAKATVLDACEFFVLYKFFAFPVVDDERRVVGVIDVSLFAEEVLQAGDTKQQQLPAAPVRDDIFEALGFHLEQVRAGSPVRVFRYRFRWLLVTVTAGTICALLAGLFELTLARSLRSRQTSTLALIVPDVTNAFWTTVARGVEDAAQAEGYSVLLCNTDESLSKQTGYINAVLQQRVDGVMIAPYDSDPNTLKPLRMLKTPVVVLDRRVEGWDVGRTGRVLLRRAAASERRGDAAEGEIDGGPASAGGCCDL